VEGFAMYEFVLENGFRGGPFSGKVGCDAEGFVHFGVARDHQTESIREDSIRGRFRVPRTLG
jgi:hypothetical protein